MSMNFKFWSRTQLKISSSIIIIHFRVFDISHANPTRKVDEALDGSALLKDRPRYRCSLVLFQRQPYKLVARSPNSTLFLYVLSDPGAQLRYGGSGERFPGFVEYSARRPPRCRIPGRRCPRTVLRRWLCKRFTFQFHFASASRDRVVKQYHQVAGRLTQEIKVAWIFVNASYVSVFSQYRLYSNLLCKKQQDLSEDMVESRR